MEVKQLAEMSILIRQSQLDSLNRENSYNVLLGKTYHQAQKLNGMQAEIESKNAVLDKLKATHPEIYKSLVK